MNQNPPNMDSSDHLNQLAERIIALHSELYQDVANTVGDAFQDKFRTLHGLKEEYKRRTGIYPNLPDPSADRSQDG